MDLQIVTLEVTSLIIAFDHYERLTFNALSKNAGLNDDYQKILNKNAEHLAESFNQVQIYDAQRQLKNLPVIKEAIYIRLAGMKSNEIHELVEHLEKDTKKMKKLYKLTSK